MRGSRYTAPPLSSSGCVVYRHFKPSIALATIYSNGTAFHNLVGAFRRKADYSNDRQECSSITFVDFNGDGYLDMRILYESFISNQIYYFYLWDAETEQYKLLIDSTGRFVPLSRYDCFPDEQIVINVHDDEFFGACTVYALEGNVLRLLRDSEWRDPWDGYDDGTARVLYVLDAPRRRENYDIPWEEYYHEHLVIEVPVLSSEEINEAMWVDALFTGLRRPKDVKITSIAEWYGQ